jgi:hypothetical protein
MRYSLFLAGFALCVGSLPATAGTLFSDLGPSGNVYEMSAYGVGYGPAPGDTTAVYTDADLFTVSGSGSEAVSQIDLGVSNIFGSGAFYAAIWTDSGGAPGTQVSGAYWNLVTTIPYDNCCSLVSVAGITGVTLNGGQEYFMVVGPASLTDGSTLGWYLTLQQGLLDYSPDGGSTWQSEGTQFTGAFDVVGTPEPGTMVMLGSGLLALGLLRKRLRR